MMATLLFLGLHSPRLNLRLRHAGDSGDGAVSQFSKKRSDALAQNFLRWQFHERIVQIFQLECGGQTAEMGNGRVVICRMGLFHLLRRQQVRARSRAQEPTGLGGAEKRHVHARFTKRGGQVARKSRLTFRAFGGAILRIGVEAFQNFQKVQIVSAFRAMRDRYIFPLVNRGDQF